MHKVINGGVLGDEVHQMVKVFVLYAVFFNKFIEGSAAIIFNHLDEAQQG